MNVLCRWETTFQNDGEASGETLCRIPAAGTLATKYSESLGTQNSGSGWAGGGHGMQQGVLTGISLHILLKGPNLLLLALLSR